MKIKEELKEQDLGKVIRISIQGGIPMKTKEELNVLKAEVETLNKKLAELTDEELSQVAGGWIGSSDAPYFANVIKIIEKEAALNV